MEFWSKYLFSFVLWLKYYLVLSDKEGKNNLLNLRS